MREGRLTNEEVDVVVRQLEHSRVKVLLVGTSDQRARGPEDHVDVWVRNQPFDPRIVQQFALFHLVELTQNLGSSLKTFHKIGQDLIGDTSIVVQLW